MIARTRSIHDESVIGYTAEPFPQRRDRRENLKLSELDIQRRFFRRVVGIDKGGIDDHRPNRNSKSEAKKEAAPAPAPKNQHANGDK